MEDDTLSQLSELDYADIEAEGDSPPLVSVSSSSSSSSLNSTGKSNNLAAIDLNIFKRGSTIRLEREFLDTPREGTSDSNPSSSSRKRSSQAPSVDEKDDSLSRDKSAESEEEENRTANKRRSVRKGKEPYRSGTDASSDDDEDYDESKERERGRRRARKTRKTVERDRSNSVSLRDRSRSRSRGSSVDSSGSSDESVSSDSSTTKRKRGRPKGSGKKKSSSSSGLLAVEDPDGDLLCVICNRYPYIVRTHKCSALFCHHCIDRWIKTRQKGNYSFAGIACPACRGSIPVTSSEREIAHLFPFNKANERICRGLKERCMYCNTLMPMTTIQLHMSTCVKASDEEKEEHRQLHDEYDSTVRNLIKLCDEKQAPAPPLSLSSTSNPPPVSASASSGSGSTSATTASSSTSSFTTAREREMAIRETERSIYMLSEILSSAGIEEEEEEYDDDNIEPGASGEINSNRIDVVSQARDPLDIRARQARLHNLLNNGPTNNDTSQMNNSNNGANSSSSSSNNTSGSIRGNLGNNVNANRFADSYNRFPHSSVLTSKYREFWSQERFRSSQIPLVIEVIHQSEESAPTNNTSRTLSDLGVRDNDHRRRTNGGNLSSSSSSINSTTQNTVSYREMDPRTLRAELARKRQQLQALNNNAPLNAASSATAPTQQQQGGRGGNGGSRGRRRAGTIRTVEEGTIGRGRGGRRRNARGGGGRLDDEEREAEATGDNVEDSEDDSGDYYNRPLSDSELDFVIESDNDNFDDDGGSVHFLSSEDEDS